MKDSSSTLSILRSFIREEIGRNFHTIIDSPYTFSDFQDYDIHVNNGPDGAVFLSVLFKREKILPMQRFASHEDALHTARMIIDKDRVTRMNHGKKENKKEK